MRTRPGTGHPTGFSRENRTGEHARGGGRRAGRALRVGALAAVLVCAGGLTGCLRAAATEPDTGGRLAVVATTPVVADFARQVGAGRVSVTELLRPNVDPHDYEPSPADLVALHRAAVVVRNGAGLESWLRPTIAASGFHGVLVDASHGVSLRRPHGQVDPHIWHDPTNAEIMCRNIAAGLSRKDPAGRSRYQANLAGYLTRLRALDADLRSRIARIPLAARTLVTNHDAFGYYARHFGLRVDPVLPNFDTSAELSGRDLDRVVDDVRRTGTRAVFSESALPDRAARTIGRRAGVRVVSGEDSLYADTLGPPGSPASTYLAMEEHNTRVIVAALR